MYDHAQLIMTTMRLRKPIKYQMCTTSQANQATKPLMCVLRN